MANHRPDFQGHADVPSPSGRLGSWKEIAAYLKSSERTVRRWEKEGLPVHRHTHKKKAAIYAYKAEIDLWWNDGRARPEEMQSSPAAQRRRWPLRAAAALSVATLIAAAVFALATGGLRSRPFHRAAVPRIHSIAVLPLENLSHDPDQEYFAEGMTDELITDLAQISALRVTSRNSVMQYKTRRLPTPRIARELNVDALVEGTVSRSGGLVRITAQLIDARSDRHLWAATYERDLRDVLGLQDEVARAIADEIEIKLTPQERARLAAHRPVSPAAHETYLRGLYELHGMTAETSDDLGLQSIQRAIAFFQQALAQDPNDSLAYAGLADAYRDLSTGFRAPLDVMPKAKAAAIKAIELDDSTAEAHAALGAIEFVFDWDWPSAEREFHRALDLNPSLPQAHADYAEYLLFVSGRPDESMREFQRAYALDPLLPYAHGNQAWFLFLAQRYQESITVAQRVGNDDPVMALDYAELGKRDLAVAAADRSLASERNPAILAQIAAAYALAGKKDQARTLLARVEAQGQKRYVCGFNVAGAYAVLGDKERAFAWLNKAFLNRSD